MRRHVYGRPVSAKPLFLLKANLGCACSTYSAYNAHITEAAALASFTVGKPRDVLYKAYCVAVLRVRNLLG